MAVSERSDMGHDVFFSRSDRGIKAYAYHEEIVPYSQSTLKDSISGSCSALSALEQIEDMMVRIAKVHHPN